MIANLLRAIERGQMLFIGVFAVTAFLGLTWHTHLVAGREAVGPHEILARDVRVQLECVPQSGRLQYRGSIGEPGPSGDEWGVEFQAPKLGRFSLEGRPVVLNERLEFVRVADAAGLPSPSQAVMLWIFIATLLAGASSLIFAAHPEARPPSDRN